MPQYFIGVAGYRHCGQRMTMNRLSAPTERLTNASLFSLVRSWLTGSRLVSLPFSDHCELLVEHADQLRKLCGYVESLRKVERWNYVEIRSSNSLSGLDSDFSPATTYQLHRLDLRPNLDALRKGFHKDCIQ
jgi:hypothetical protein